MPAAAIPPAYQQAFGEPLPLSEGQKLRDLLKAVRGVVAYQPLGKPHWMVMTCDAHGHDDLRPATPPHSPPKVGGVRGPAAVVAPAAMPPAFSAGDGAEAAETAHVFVDYSNLWWGSGAKDEGKTLRLGALAALLLGGRSLGEYSLVAGSKPHPDHPLWAEWERLGFGVSLEPVKLSETNRRAGGGGESQVDDVLHAAIFHEVHRRRAEPAASQTLVLVTGDGKGNGGRSNFPDCCQAALDKGWRVEVWGWGGGMAGSLKRLAARSGGAMAVHLLDEHRDRLVVPASSAAARCRSPSHLPPGSAGARRRLPRTPSPVGGCDGHIQHDGRLGPVRPRTPPAPAAAPAAAAPASGERMRGQFRAGGSWKPCQVISALPIIGMDGHVLVQFDGYPDSLPLPTNRLRAWH
jgi:hypothetical protein